MDPELLDYEYLISKLVFVPNKPGYFSTISLMQALDLPDGRIPPDTWRYVKHVAAILKGLGYSSVMTERETQSIFVVYPDVINGIGY